MRWLLCDYGGVLSLPQSPADLDSLGELTGLGRRELVPRYWADRPAYDRGDLEVADYWAAVTGGPLPPDDLDAVVAADVSSWLHLDPDSIAAAERARARGYRLALLSNAPVEVARGIDALPELAAFDPRWFSCDLRVIGPEPEIYLRVLAELGTAPAGVVFFDDRPDNVEAAAAVGITALRFERADQFDRLSTLDE